MYSCLQTILRLSQHCTKGNSSSRELFDLVVQFRKLGVEQEAKFYVSHFSTERMKAEGVDGASRGHLKEGVTIGEDMLSFIPLDKRCLEQVPLLKEWTRLWAGY
jgi:hypothetical protein